jgi:hypothetical protein
MPDFDASLDKLAAIWQLVALSNWIIDLLEKLMKECVLSYSSDMTSLLKREEDDDLFGSISRQRNFP